MGEAYRSLSEKDKTLIDSYFSNGWNQTKAYLIVNPDTPYETARVNASKYFAKSNIKEARKERTEGLLSSIESDIKTRVLKTLINQAFYDPADIIDLDGNIKPEAMENPDLSVCIHGIESIPYGSESENVRTRVKLVDRDKALEKLYKWQKLATDSVSVNMNVVYIPEDHKDL